jgi:glycosyltransferase involved in cell wall biosynthesis
MKKDKILFVKKYNTNPKFITNDFDILSGSYDVTLNNVKTTNNAFIIITLIKEFFYLLFTLWNYKLVYIWFADYHSFLPVLFSKILGKKSVICAGGYESTYIPEINCGVFTRSSFSKKVRAFCVAYSLKNCSLILPVDETLIENTNSYIYSDIPGKPALKDGIKNFIKDIMTSMETVYLGYDANVFKKVTVSPKEYSVVSAGLIVNDDEYRRKGFDLLCAAAKVMPDVKFVLIGLNDEYYNKLTSLNIPNLVPLKIITYGELIEQYSRAKVFAQISMFEGMPSTLCEAMMCECIPVGSNVNGIPKIIGDTGFLVSKKEIGEVTGTLYKALNADEKHGKAAREHVISSFPIEERKKKLLIILNKLI